MSHCSCSSAASAVQVFSFQDLSAIAATANSAAASQGFGVTNLVIADGRALFASGTQDGQKGCFQFKIFGTIDASLCWEFVKFQVGSSVDVQIKFTATVAGLKVFEKVLYIKCENILRPDTCNIGFDSDAASAGINAVAGVDWKCLAGCAPKCLSCGTSYWCWIMCAGPCVVKCLL